MRSTRPVTGHELTQDLCALGVRRGTVLMVHTRMSAIGWVVGGAETVVAALLDALGPDGTLLAYVGWSDGTGGMDEWPPEWQDTYRRARPPFNALFSESDAQMGRVPERIRTWPGAKVSGSHFRRMVAIGPKAGWLTENQPWDHAFGPGSPLAKLVEAEVHDHDTSTARGAFPYQRAVGDREPFEVIGRLALQAGAGVTGQVGEAESHLFAAPRLVAFVMDWLTGHFGYRD
jgi:aminoglycoside 3-N-acetyltransferase